VPSSFALQRRTATRRYDQIMDVLLVDDDERVRVTLRRVLRRLGFDGDDAIAEAGDGAEALRRLEQADATPGALRLIVTDCQMPNMDGIRLTRALRAAGVAIPILMLSGADDRAIVQAALRAGVNRFLAKPADLDELCEVLHELVGQFPSAAA
jgi:two-component system response regulator MprA